MCGVPVHAAEAYLEKLIRKGFRVAVCEQMEDPARRRNAARNRRSSAKSSAGDAGTLTEETLLDARAPSVLELWDARRASSRLPGPNLDGISRWQASCPPMWRRRLRGSTLASCSFPDRDSELFSSSSEDLHMAPTLHKDLASQLALGLRN